MRAPILPALTCTMLLAAIFLATPATAATYCVHGWAEPGTYRVTGQFRKRVQTTTADVTPGCRVSINVPGVFTGGPLQAAGACVKFGFRVEGEPGTFTARWCDSYVVIPYNGRDVRAEVQRIERREPGRPRTNWQ